MDHDLAQQGQGWLQPVPDPGRQPLAGRILQTFDVVEIVVIQLVVQRLERGLDVGEIHDPAGLRVEVAGDMDLDAEGMAMEARALVARRHVGQPVGGFEGEDLEDIHGEKFRGRRVPDRAGLRLRPAYGRGRKDGGYGCNRIGRVNY